jgi:hypothetical protein
MSDTNDVHRNSECLLNLIKQRYGDRLTPAEWEEVKKGIDGITVAAAALRKVKLDNHDEPFSVFVPYRGEG